MTCRLYGTLSNYNTYEIPAENFPQAQSSHSTSHSSVEHFTQPSPSASMPMPLQIIQHGFDGLGHQLYGLLSVMVLHGMNGINFNAQSFIDKKFIFQHLSKKEMWLARNYMQSIADGFMKENACALPYKNVKKLHSLSDVLKQKNDGNTVYTVDSGFGNFNESDIYTRKNNAKKIKKYFQNSVLPKKRHSSKTTAVHIRLGDAMRYPRRKREITSHNNKLGKLMEKLYKASSDSVFLVHSDGDASFVTDVLSKLGAEYKLYQKKENIMDVLSDLMYADILVCANSALSKIAANVGNHALVICEDELTKDLMPENTVKISEY